MAAEAPAMPSEGAEELRRALECIDALLDTLTEVAVHHRDSQSRIGGGLSTDNA
jgi:hypothetical protein